MARVIQLKDATSMGLPGRQAHEIVSAHAGSAQMTFRRVEIPVPEPGAAPRAQHVHDGFEECIHIVSGRGEMQAGSDSFLAVGPGDTILVPANEPHATRNTGAEPLVMLCFFPVPDIRPGTRELG
ncbi:cupin domain-containing protein [Amorphus coralli]|uniref:cupin domain-containing protein n=1 Tax=Amorphus coralli TaxID=340680 RepID=UPI000367B66A|nr:cupin domain-containing protein [Amorphus coralli]